MKDNFLIWKYKSVDGACVLKDLRGLEKTFRLNNGTPLAAGFPGDVAFHMHPDFPTDLLLVDNLLNSDMVIVASKRLQDCVRAQSPSEVEYLPVKIIDHKGRIASKDYAIIHPVRPVDCIDKQHSVFETNPIDPDDIETLEKLVIDEAKIPADRRLFRMQGFWGMTLVRNALAAAIAAGGFSGVEFLSIDDYPEA